ncbi:hypothetical protein [Chitinophaga sp. CF418]|uniref:hypothetical protein n=1 Tax=Chitinophaga sp. CF418 TaxID=1855287 RepID=UPI0009201630|nr:hypothetical protein [Chitinophaga sp. CF418]SHM14119.1 hypothetical protein SAMN05216311_101700 [Chitinophaga sp. CF418]
MPFTPLLFLGGRVLTESTIGGNTRRYFKTWESGLAGGKTCRVVESGSGTAGSTSMIDKDAGTVCPSHEVEQGTWELDGHTIDINGVLQQGIITSYDCKTLICYVENGITQGDRMTYTLTKQ